MWDTPSMSNAIATRIWLLDVRNWREQYNPRFGGAQ